MIDKYFTIFLTILFSAGEILIYTIWTKSITTVLKNDWDVLIGTNSLASWGWLRTIEETLSLNWNPLYLLLYDSEKHLIGAAICEIVNGLTDDRMDALIFGRLKKIAWRSGISMAPALVCGTCGTYGAHLFTHPSLSPNNINAIENNLLDSLDSKAHELKLPIVFVHVLASQSHLMAHLDKRNFTHTLIPPMTQLDIKWINFIGYENHTKKISLNSFKMIRKERNRNKREGVKIKVLTDFEPYQKRLIELLNMTTYKYSGVPFWYKNNFFSKLKNNLGNNVVIFSAWKKEKLVAVCVMLCTSNEGFLTEIGVDHGLCENDFTYFNIAYYAPIEYAISNNLKTIHLDNALQELKLRRGFYLVNDHIYYKSNKSVSQNLTHWFFKLHTAWFQRKHAHLKRYHSSAQKT